MKSTIILSIFCFCTIGILRSQPEPIKIQFVEAQPIWEHLMWDSTFYSIGNQPGLNKYTTVVPRECYRFNNDLFLTSFCQNFNGEIYGYVFEKLDANSGQTLWQSFNTYYNNGLQDFYKNLYLRSDGKLEMIGIKHHGPYIDSIPAFWNTGGGKSNYIRKIFDYVNGNLLETIVGEDSISNIVPQYMNFYPVIFDSSYLAINLTGESSNGQITYGYKFYGLNSQNTLIDTLPIANILYETNDQVGLFSYGQPQMTERINDSTLVGLVFQDKSHPGSTRAQLLWMDIKDINNIQVTRRLNIETLIPGQEQSFLYFTYKVVNNRIYISQPYKDNTLNEYTSFLLCFDENGNVLHNIQRSKIDTTIYQSLNLIYSSSTYDYLAASPSKTGRKGFDILKLNIDADTLQFISSITSANLDENFALQMEVNNLYDDGLFVIGAYTKKEGPVLNTAVKYYCFDGKDLGMEVVTATNNIHYDDGISLYPNPSTGFITIRFPTIFAGQINVYDNAGKQVESYLVDKTDHFELNAENYPSGIYHSIILNKASTRIPIVKSFVITK